MENIKCAYCGMSVTPTELNFEAVQGSVFIPGYQFFKTRTVGAGCIPGYWDVVVDADWLKIDNYSGECGEGIRVNVSVASLSKPVGTYTANVTFTSTSIPGGPWHATVTFTVKAKPLPLRITTITLPDGKVGEAYSYQIEAEGGVPPYKWSQTGLPDGLTFDSQTASITGTLLAGGFFSVNITVQDSSSSSYTMQYTLDITEPPAPPVKIVIMSPGGGEVWYENDIEDITWVAENVNDETLDIHLILDGVMSVIAIDVPVKSLGYLWTISGIPVSENAVIALLTNYQAIQCPPFAIRERSGCAIPWPLAKALKKLRKSAKQYWEA